MSTCARVCLGLHVSQTGSLWFVRVSDHHRGYAFSWSWFIAFCMLKCGIVHCFVSPVVWYSFVSVSNSCSSFYVLGVRVLGQAVLNQGHVAALRCTGSRLHQCYALFPSWCLHLCVCILMISCMCLCACLPVPLFYFLFDYICIKIK